MATRKEQAAAKASATGPQGTVLRASGRHGPQVTETMGRFWSDEAEGVFLDKLAATCNVTLAARACGFSGVTVYRRRRRDPAFAQRWEAALVQGYARLETALIRRATETFDGPGPGPGPGPGAGPGAGPGPDPDAPLRAVTFAEALNLLRLHKSGAAAERARRGAGPQRRPRTLDDVRDAILTKLEAIIAMREEDAAAADLAAGGRA